MQQIRSLCMLLDKFQVRLTAVALVIVEAQNKLTFVQGAVIQLVKCNGNDADEYR